MSMVPVRPILGTPVLIVDAIPTWIWNLPREDAPYMGKVRCLPCCICEAFGMAQTSHTEAHHPIHGRFSNEKAPDGAAIPLCMCHHQGLRFDRDRSKLAIHQGKETWDAEYGRDYEHVLPTRIAILGDHDIDI